MKELLAFIVLLFVTMFVSVQTEVETDSIDTSAFDKYLDEILTLLWSVAAGNVVRLK